MTDLRIVVVDDHPVVRAGLRGIFEGSAGFAVVGEAADGLAALEVVAATRPDVVLLDLRMPVLDGAGTLQRLAADHPGVRVLVLTTYDQDQDILRAVEAGATGVLLKDAPREELFRAVRAVARGESVLAAGLTARLLDRWRAPKADAPTDRELEVLRLVARGLTNRAIGRQLSISEATVKTHLVHAFDKLGVDDRTAAVTVALERGLLVLDR
jgi:DNA-binding NarL/FixJ family response regulator